MSLLQDVLRSQVPDSALLEKRLNKVADKAAHGSASDESDDELVNVEPQLARGRLRPRAMAQPLVPLRGPLHISSRRDLLKALPTEISQRIFRELSPKDLANCALVSKKWSRSQTINYVWFQHYRNENFHDDSLPPGKWTKRESKQNWRVMHLQNTAGQRSPGNGSAVGMSRVSGYTSPLKSGAQTPRELKEEKWRQEAETTAPGKLEMRSLYKELNGRKSKEKSKWGSSGVRDKGGWSGDGDY
ncbi:Dolichol-phosphate mannosyltransferase subunit 1 [Mycena sanguinolenta]|uniref:Dolichol-phosphate mannosyltransferase subunit 1 n=1 Tax=Mycena sanguinolenta TaxID=230812 RepID=A0A8H6YQF0_9AGAR|nr:Dolichol-phosphate mannosyltransferase subunit 1 [Mycena sanguinolenta]